MRTRFQIAALAAALTAVLSAGCSCGGPAPCTQTTQCSAGAQCADGQCLLPCTDPASCAQGTTCASGFCRVGCTANTQCTVDQACAGQVCRPRGCGGQTCAADNVCIDGVCSAIACAGVTCPAGERCAAGTCYGTSCGGTQCSATQVCKDGACTDAACVGVVCPAGTSCLGGSCLGTGDALPYSVLCDEMGKGYKNSSLAAAHVCASGATVDEDTAHQAFLNVTGTNRPTSGTNALIWQLVSCGGYANDAGLVSSALATLEQSMDAGRIRYDGLKARACMNAGFDAGIAPECRQVFVPLVGLGGACARTEECPDDAYCRPSSNDTCAGTCVTRLAPGAACEPTRDLCLDSTCTFTGAAGNHCQAPAARDGGLAGASCDVYGRTASCASNLRCVLSSSGPLLPDGGPTGLCTSAVGDGLPCGVGASAALAPACAASCSSCFSVDGGVGTCRAQGGASVPCRLDGDCQPFHLCVQGACRLMPRPGEACVPTSDGSRGDCRWADNYCRMPFADAGTGTCTALPTLNQACGARYDLTDTCALGTCDRTSAAGVCHPDPTEGQACNSTCSGSSLRCESHDGGPRLCWAPPTTGQPCNGTCDAVSRCASNVCVARYAAGSVCATNGDCLSNNCLEGQKICAASCFSALQPLGTYGSGCPNGLRDWTILLAFSALGLVWAGRRRERQG